MKKSELRKLIKEELLKEDSEINKADNNVFSAMLALGRAFMKEVSKEDLNNVETEFNKIRDDYNNKIMKLYKKYKL